MVAIVHNALHGDQRQKFEGGWDLFVMKPQQNNTNREGRMLHLVLGIGPNRSCLGPLQRCQGDDQSERHCHRAMVV